MSILFAALLWSGAACVYAGGVRWRSSLGWALALAGAGGTIALANGPGSGVAEASAHFLSALTLFAVAVPLLKKTPLKPWRAPRPLKAPPPLHGVGRITAAVLIAPVAGALLSVALPALVPLSSDVRYLVAIVAVVPAMTIAPWLALQARSALRAWAVSGGVAVSSLVVIWSSFP